MTLQLNLRIDGDAAGAVKAARETATNLEAVGAAARMGGTGTQGYTEALGRAYGIQTQLNKSQVETIRNLETQIGRQTLLNAGRAREAAQFQAVRAAQTTADTAYGRVLARLAGEHYDLQRAQDRSSRSAGNLADTLTRRFVGGIILAQLGNMVRAAAALNSELAKTGDIAARTGIASGDLQGLQAAAGTRGIGGNQFLDDMLRFDAAVSSAKRGVGDLAALFRLNGIAVKDTQQSFLAVANLVRDAGEEARKFRILQEAGLPATRQMVRFMEQGSDAIRQQRNEADKLTGQQLADAQRIEDRWNEMWTNFAQSGKRAIVGVEDSFRNLSKWPERGTPLADFIAMAQGQKKWSVTIDLRPEAGSAVDVLLKRLGWSGGANRDMMPGAGMPTVPVERGADLAPLVNRPRTRTKGERIESLQREQQRLALLGQTATVAEVLRQKENELELARLQGNVSIGDRAELLKRLTVEQKIGITQIRDATNAREIEEKTFNMSAGAAAAYTAVHNALNEARARGEDLAPGYVVAISREAAAMGAATERVKALAERRESIDFLRDQTKSFMADIRSAQEEGARGWKAWEKAGENAIGRIMDKLSEMVMDEAFAAIGGSKTGGLSGFLCSLFGGGAGAPGALGAGIGGSAYSIGFGGIPVPVFHTGRFPGAPKPSYRVDDPQLYATAPRFHNGRTPAGLAPGELRAIIRDDELVVPADRLGRGGAGGDVINQTFNVDASGQGDGAAIGQQMESFVRGPRFKQAVRDVIRDARGRREAL